MNHGKHLLQILGTSEVCSRERWETEKSLAKNPCKAASLMVGLETGRAGKVKRGKKVEEAMRWGAAQFHSSAWV